MFPNKPDHTFLFVVMHNNTSFGRILAYTEFIVAVFHNTVHSLLLSSLFLCYGDLINQVISSSIVLILILSYREKYLDRAALVCLTSTVMGLSTTQTLSLLAKLFSAGPTIQAHAFMLRLNIRH